MVTNFTKSWTENVKARKGHEKFRGKLHKTRDDVSTSPFVEGPHAGKDVGADRSHLDHRPKAKAPAPREAALVQEGTGSHGKTEGKAGMHIPESVGIPLVIEQKQKIASLTNLHALVTQMKFKEICQDKIPLGGWLEAFRENWEMITNDQKFLDSISGYKIEFQEQPIQKRPPKQIKLSQQETQILNAEIEEMLTKKAVEVVQTATENHFVSHLFVRPKKRWGNETYFQHESPEPVCSVQSLPNGGVSCCKEHHSTWGLVMQSRPERCLFLHTNPSQSQEIPEISVQRANATVSQPSLWTGDGIKAIYKGNETNNSPSQTNRSQTCDLSRRHFVVKPITSRTPKRQRYTPVASSQSRVVGKLEKIGPNSQPKTRICGTYNKFNRNGDNSVRNKSGKNKTKMLRDCKQTKGVNSRTVKPNRYPQLDSRGCDSSLTIRQRTTDVSNKESVENRENYPKMTELSQSCKGKITWWITQLELWNGKSIQMSTDPDLIIETDASKTGWGAFCPTLSLKMGGPWNQTEKLLHINALELKAVQFAVQSLIKEREKIHIHIKSDNTTTVAHLNSMGGTKSGLLVKITKEIWALCLSKKITLTSEHLPGVQNTIADK